MPTEDWLIIDDKFVCCTPSTIAQLEQQAQNAYEDGDDKIIMHSGYLTSLKSGGHIFVYKQGR